MNKFRKLSIVSAFFAPALFCASSEVGAEQLHANSHEATTATTEYYSNASAGTYQPNVENVPQFKNSDVEESYSDDSDKSLLLLCGVGAVAFSGTVFACIYLNDRRRGVESVRMIQDYQTQQHTNIAEYFPRGPEDDPTFWPPKSASES